MDSTGTNQAAAKTEFDWHAADVDKLRHRLTAQELESLIGAVAQCRTMERVFGVLGAAGKFSEWDSVAAIRSNAVLKIKELTETAMGRLSRPEGSLEPIVGLAIHFEDESPRVAKKLYQAIQESRLLAHCESCTGNGVHACANCKGEGAIMVGSHYAEQNEWEDCPQCEGLAVEICQCVTKEARV